MSKTFWVYHRLGRWERRKPHTFIPMGKGVLFLWTATGSFAMRYSPYRGIRKIAWWPTGGYPCVSLDGAAIRWGDTDVKKVKVQDRSSVKHLAPLESEMFREHLAVIEVLAMLTYADGSPREAGYLGMWTQGATWFVRVQDKTGEAQLTAEGRTAEEAWDTLQLLLGSDNPPWEPMSRRKKKGA